MTDENKNITARPRTAEYTCVRCERVLRGYIGRQVCPTCWKKK